MTDPVAPAPSSPVVSLTPPAGYTTSEAWLTFLAQLPALILNSPLVANAPILVKVISIIAAAFTVIGYQTNRTNLKKAHLAACSGTAAPANSNKAPIAAAGAVAALLAILVGLGTTQSAAAAPAPATQASAARVNAAMVGLSCVTQDLALLKTASDDLVGADYEQAISGLVATSGNTATGCAVLQIQAVAEAGKTSGAAAMTPIELRAREMIAKYKWAAIGGGK